MAVFAHSTAVKEPLVPPRSQMRIPCDRTPVPQTLLAARRRSWAPGMTQFATSWYSMMLMRGRTCGVLSFRKPRLVPRNAPPIGSRWAGNLSEAMSTPDSDPMT